MSAPARPPYGRARVPLGGTRDAEGAPRGAVARGWPRRAWALAALLALASPAGAAGLVELWQAAARHDRGFALARAARAAAQPRQAQADALWRPNVALTAQVGLAANETETRGARFSAPGFGAAEGASFDTSVDRGLAGRISVSAVQPLYNPQRRAQQRQLSLAVDIAELELQAAGQTLMLQTAERYFEVALGDATLQALAAQRDAVARAATEARDRFTLGALPVTDTHEANARLAAIRAQWLAAESDAALKRQWLADSTGLAPATLTTRLPAASTAAAPLRPLDTWLADALDGNPTLRMQALAVEVARAEATRHGVRASTSVDLVAQASRERVAGHGDFGSASQSAASHQIGVVLSVPLSTGGYRNAKEDEAWRLADQAQARVEASRQQVAQQVRTAWAGLRIGAERLRALDEALAASQARREATLLGRQVGDRTTQDLLLAESDHAAALLAVRQARVALALDRLRLAALAGRLDDALLREVDAGLDPLPPGPGPG